MRYVKKHFFSKLMLTVLIIGTVIAINLTNINNSFSQTVTNDCSNLSMTVTNANNSITNYLYGEVYVKISTPSIPQPTKITVMANQKIIGQAQPSSSNTWLFKWVSSVWPTPGNVSLDVKIQYNEGYFCQITNDVIYRISSAPSIFLNSYSIPSKLSVMVNSINSIKLTSSLLPTPDLIEYYDINPYVIYEWPSVTPLGNLYVTESNFSNNDNINFFANNKIGNDTIFAKAIYGGVEKIIEIPISVNSNQTNPSPENPNTSVSNNISTDSSDDITSSSNTSSSATNETTQAIPTTETQITSSKLQVSKITQSCLESEINPDRYLEIINKDSLMTANELEKTMNCFATSKYILPSIFSPINPLEIEKINVDSRLVSISKIENVPTTVESSNGELLKISGKSKPESLVLIYIYSDPLIITTKSDKEGNWQYTINDPMQPGKHEVYVVVNKEDGSFNRSNSFEFIISNVAASELNPNGLNLKLSGNPTETASQSNNNLIYYVTVSTFVILVAIMILLIIIKINKNKNKFLVPSVTDISQINTNESTSTINSQDNENRTPFIQNERIMPINENSKIEKQDIQIGLNIIQDNNINKEENRSV
ncbi:MAG TPA: hypothetical protein PLO25_02975 [Candidatus Saccharibacteria bacterium]|nr:hypothetical protein [Candidatus Saccharibacteria bacterium]